MNTTLGKIYQVYLLCWQLFCQIELRDQQNGYDLQVLVKYEEQNSKALLVNEECLFPVINAVIRIFQSFEENITPVQLIFQ